VATGVRGPEPTLTATTIGNRRIDTEPHDRIDAMIPDARLATTDDIGEIVRLRRVLFESLGATEGGWEHTCAAILDRGISEGWMVVCVVDQPMGDALAAVGTAEIQQRLPGPANPSGLLGYIGTMATDPAFRRRGLASAILDRLVTELRARGVDRIELHATPAAEPLYRTAGFADRPGGVEMRLVDA
jgi:ribosomal protein S18 acetylase RimI-like enzyme